MWLWIIIAVVVLLGVVKLILLPEQRRRRGLANNDVNMPAGYARRADAAGVDPIVGQHSGNMLGGQQNGPS